MNDRRRAERIDEVLAAWHDRRVTDPNADSGELLIAHPDLAVDLAARLAAEQLLLLAFPERVVDPPNTLGDFRVLGEIGRGGMGVVYEAEQVSMRRRVALKVLHPAVTLNPQATERFRREAQAAGRVHHTNIVPVFAMGQDSGCWYYAMEFVQGRTLAEIIGDLRRLGAGPAAGLPTPTGAGLGSSSAGREFYIRVARAFAGVADALHAAHLANVVHRDIKPSNLILDDDGTLKITDFGLARMDGELPTVTLTGAVIGTPGYMSPEQVRPEGRHVDARSDIYSLGATLYELLALRAPFRGRVEDVLAKILRGDPTPPRAFERRIPRDLETIVLKAMENDSERRYRTAADMAHDLVAFADGATIEARRVGPVVRAWRLAARNRARTALVLALVTALGIAATLGAAALRAEAERSRESAARRDLEYRSLVSRALVGDDRALEHALVLAPERADAWYVRAFHRNSPLEARLADLDSARERGLSDARYRWTRAVLFRQAGRLDEAEEEERRAPAAADPEVETLRATIAVEKGRLEDAELLLDRVITGATPDDDVWMRALAVRAQLRSVRNVPEDAIEDLMALRGRIPADAPVPGLDARIAWLWKRLGRFEAAARHVDVVLASYHRLGDIRLYQEFAAALWTQAHDEDSFRRVVEVCPEIRLPASVPFRAPALLSSVTNYAVPPALTEAPAGGADAARISRRIRLWFATGSAARFAGTPSPVTGLAYQFHDLGAGFPVEIDDAGETFVTGSRSPGVAALWIVAPDGAITPVPNLPGGTFVGGVGTGAGFPRLHNPLAAGGHGLVYGYGDTGKTYEDEGRTLGVVHAFVFDPQSGISDVGTLDGTVNSYPFDMDDAGWLYVLAYGPAAGGVRAFVWHRDRPGTRVEIWQPGRAGGIDPTFVRQKGGKVLLRTAPAGGSPVHTYVWDRASGVFTSVDDGVAVVNARGELLGASAAGPTHWSAAGKATAIQDLVPALSPSESVSARGRMLTDSGWVVGSYLPRDHVSVEIEDPDGTGLDAEMTFAWNTREPSGGAYDLRREVEAVGAFAAVPAAVTEAGRIVGYMWRARPEGSPARHVFTWDAEAGLVDLTPGDGPSSSALEAVSPTGMVAFQNGLGDFFAWQRVGRVSTTLPLPGFDVGGGWWYPTLFANARGEIVNVSVVEGEYHTILAVPAGLDRLRPK